MLKATELHRVAYLTGTASSGTKTVLIERLGRALEEGNQDGGGGDESVPVSPSASRLVQSPTSHSADGEMRILSIDMGIRNLAYAHLRVSRSRDVRSAGNGKKEGEDGGLCVRLDAWNRLAVSSFPVEDAGVSGPTIALDKFNGGTTSPNLADATTKTTSKKSKRKSLKAGAATDVSERPVSSDTDISDQAKEIVAKESFAPHIYASHAYTLITTLLSTYKPTHVLIERQRFRSSGGTAVQEWTIRVGVFEAMLYAVLQTLKSENRRRRMQLGTKSKKSGTADEINLEDVTVLGVDPRRVANYWIVKMMGEKPKGKGRGKAYSKEGKKAKIDVIKSVLSGNGTSNLLMSGQSIRFVLEDNAQVREVARAFLKKLDGKKKTAAVKTAKGKTKAAKKSEGTEEPERSIVETTDMDIGKLDDLADCFLQGLTWLGWRDMRARIAKGGLDAVPFDE